MRMFALAVSLALAGACGDVTGPGGGGGGSDGGPDGGGPGADAAVPGVVQVTVLDGDGDRLPLADVPVVFFQPDGTVEAMVDTDADGMASAELFAGGAVAAFVSIQLPVGLFSPEVWAVVGVKPGDEIVLGGRQLNGPDTASMTFNLPDIKASPFIVSTPCGAFFPDAEPVLVRFFDFCDHISPFSIIAYAVQGDERQVLTTTDIELDDGAVVPIGGAWAPVPSPDVTVENIDDVGFLEMDWASAILDGIKLGLALPSLGGAVDSDQLTLSPLKMVEPEQVALRVTLFSDQAPMLGSQVWNLWFEGDGDDNDVQVDADDHRMPWVGVPVFDQTNHVFSWPQSGQGEWDGTYLQFRWTAVEGKAPTATGRVRIAVPPGVTQFVLPPVPEELAEWLPEDLDDVTPTVTLFESDALDWDQARQLGIDPGDTINYLRLLEEAQQVRYSISPDEIPK